MKLLALGHSHNLFTCTCFVFGLLTILQVPSVNVMSLPIPTSSSSSTSRSSSSTTASSLAATTAPRRTIRWGVIGLGDVVKHKTGQAFLQATGSDLVAAFTRTPGKAAAWAQASGGPATTGYDTLEEFLKDDRVDAYYIATPPGTHVSMAMRVATNKKPIYMEKPVGRSYEETAIISAALEARGIPFFTAYTSRAYPRTAALKQALETGRIGKVTNISYVMSGASMVRGLSTTAATTDSSAVQPWRLRADVSGGGIFLDVGCHLLDRLDFCAGPIVDCHGQALNRQSPQQDVEDYVWLKATIGIHKNANKESEEKDTHFCVGASVDCIWDFTGGHGGEEQDELVFQGTKGSLRMKGMSPDAPIQVLDQDGSLIEEIKFDPVTLAGLPLIQMATNELLGKGACPSKGDNARRTSAVMDTVLNGYYGGRGDDFFFRPESWPGIPPVRRELYLAELNESS